MMIMITNQKHNEQMLRKQDWKEEREERWACYENRHENHQLQLQMHQELMMQQSQFMNMTFMSIQGNCTATQSLYIDVTNHSNHPSFAEPR
jgi:hypothetical protein